MNILGKLRLVLYSFHLTQLKISQFQDLSKELGDIPLPLPGSFPLSIHDQEEHISNWNLNLQFRDNIIPEHTLKKIARVILLSKGSFLITRFRVWTLRYHVQLKQ
jgi:regulatory protein YycH of two-component signal transduction system YycFG